MRIGNTEDLIVKSIAEFVSAFAARDPGPYPPVFPVMIGRTISGEYTVKEVTPDRLDNDLLSFIVAIGVGATDNAQSWRMLDDWFEIILPTFAFTNRRLEAAMVARKMAAGPVGVLLEPWDAEFRPWYMHSSVFFHQEADAVEFKMWLDR